MKSIAIIGTALALSTTTALAASEATLIVSIDSAVPASDVQAAVDALNRHDFSTGTCWVESKVQMYIPYTDAPYHGVALVDVTYECDERLASFVTYLNNDERYTIWANSRIAPTPIVSIRN